MPEQPASTMDALGTTIKIKKEEEESDAAFCDGGGHSYDDLEQNGDFLRGSTSPLLKRCRESTSPDSVFTAPSPLPPATPQSQHQQTQNQRLFFPAAAPSASPSPPPEALAVNSSWRLPRQVKRARRDSDSNSNAHVHLAAARSNKHCNDEASSSASPPRRPKFAQNNAVLRLHDNLQGLVGTTTTIAALAEFITTTDTSSQLVTRFSWAMFLEWYHQHRHQQHHTHHRARFQMREPSVPHEEEGAMTVVHDRYSWHLALLEAQEGGGGVEVAARGGVQYLDMFEM
ncbi:hypothetical protein Micbo1qcDRAFT_179800 [Microdochium bolleyi]|uniref:Uncharacterized protein n=1 Tax=Microdochium bolleyi TaxID=196109 RepID=A0A136INP3_9PEZI|nr:hypothetical protein Micbo1qcDRAFT_179800 [Microdochium bolleyi]